LLHDYSNSQKRKTIKDECNKKNIIYDQQLSTVTDLLKALVGNTIIFASGSYEYTNINEKDVQTCISQTKDKCPNDPSSVCRMTGDTCQLVLPKKNLVTGIDNSEFYFGKMADELIRYNRIKSFIFKPKSYLSFGQIKYNLRDDEIIVLQDLLNQEFFENLIPSEINKYAKYNTFDTANPIITKAYTNEVQLDEIINPYHLRDCVKSKPEVILDIYWRNCFPDDYKEIEYINSNYCSLYLLIDIVKEFKNEELTIEDIKEDLINQYSELTDNYTDVDRIDKIVQVLLEEAQIDARQLEDRSMSFEEMISNNGFVAVNFDLWILLSYYKIPSIFISSDNIHLTRYNSKSFISYDDGKTDHFFFIFAPAMYRRRDVGALPIYKTIINDKNKMSIKISDLSE
jgi:hypothetical protein